MVNVGLRRDSRWWILNSCWLLWPGHASSASSRFNWSQRKNKNEATKAKQQKSSQAKKGPKNQALETDSLPKFVEYVNFVVKNAKTSCCRFKRKQTGWSSRRSLMPCAAIMLYICIYIYIFDVFSLQYILPIYILKATNRYPDRIRSRDPQTPICSVTYRHT
jgi:hypothetical protein